MMYTEEQLQQIEYYASIYMTITDIAVILQIRAEELRSDIHIEDSPAYLAYHKGKASSKVQPRRSTKARWYQPSLWVHRKSMTSSPTTLWLQ